jgi:hypothetical protein
MNVIEAQADMRRAYVGGGPGVFVSAMMWFVAAWVEARHGVRPAFVALFVGGMLIYPISLLASRLIFGRAREAAANPLGMVALESTIAMIGGLFAAWLMLRFEPAFVFPLAAIAVGTHYAVFRTVYGDARFWVLGAAITAIGVVEIFHVRLIGGPILAVGVIELLFAVWLTIRAASAGQFERPSSPGA